MMSINPGYSLLRTPEDLVKFTEYIQLYNLTCKIFTNFDISIPLYYLGEVKTPELYNSFSYDESPKFVIWIPTDNIKPSVINLYKMLLDTNSLNSTQDFITLFNETLSNNN